MELTLGGSEKPSCLNEISSTISNRINILTIKYKINLPFLIDVPIIEILLLVILFRYLVENLLCHYLTRSQLYILNLMSPFRFIFITNSREQCKLAAGAPWVALCLAFAICKCSLLHYNFARSFSKQNIHFAPLRFSVITHRVVHRYAQVFTTLEFFDGTVG